MSDRGEWIFGLHAVQAALEREAPIQQILVDASRHDQRVKQIIKLADERSIPLRQVVAKALDERAEQGRHQGVVANLRLQQTQDEPFLKALLKRMQQSPLLLILDEVQDPHNLGACLRTAEGAGVHAVVTPRDRSVGLTPTVRKVASGAAETIPFVQVTNLARTMKWLQEEGVWLVGTAGEAEQTLYQSDLTGPLALVMGGEGKGMRRLTREHCDLLVSLPMAGSVESLNVSVATGVALYEAVRQRGLSD